MARLRRTAYVALGWVLLVTGIALFPLPGPGLLLIAAGMAMLARHYTWAQRRVDRLQRRALLEAARGVRTPLRAVWSYAIALLLTVAGLLWLWAPAEPAWWVLPSWTWLPGGFWAGISQILSGLVTLALVAYAWWRFRRSPDWLAELEREHAASRDSSRSGMLVP